MNYLRTVLHLIIIRTVQYFDNAGYKGELQRFPGIRRIIDSVTAEDIYAWANPQKEEYVRYERLMEITGQIKEKDHVIQSAVELCLAVVYMPEFAAYIQQQTGNGVTLQLAYAIEGIEFPDPKDIQRKLYGLESICWIDRKKSPIQHLELFLDDRVMWYLMGNDLYDSSSFVVFRCSSPLHPLYANENIVERGEKHLGKSGTLLQISGRGGKRFLVKHISRAMKKDFLLYSFEKFEDLFDRKFGIKRMELMREALLLEAGICIYGITDEKLKEVKVKEEWLGENLVKQIVDRKIPLILCTDGEVNLENSEVLQEGMDTEQERDSKLLVLELPFPQYSDRKRIWKGFSKQYNLDIDCGQYAEKYRMTASETAKTLNRWHQRQNYISLKSNIEFSKLCYETIVENQESSLGKVIYPKVKMEDLKVQKYTRDLLKQVIAGVKRKQQIYEEWNLKQQYVYGKAVTALIVGPPGTGKTMSAHAIAYELERPIYQINISNIVDKYIGETEKHLEKVFDYAEKTNMVLFLDEADALLGKRSEVSDAKDKYANTGVSYLLQRLEQYDGIAVMATNFQNNIDSAFLRRMKYVIRFYAPDAQTRLEIWRGCLTDRIPRETLDFEFLANEFEFSGGTIKNIFLNACVIAAELGEPLKMKHILNSVRDEYIKTDRMVDRSMWGKYGYLMQE